AFFYNYNYNRIVTNGRVNSYWENSYKIIAGTNNILGQLEEGTSDTNDQIIAEDLYLRSLMYFYLADVFGRPYNQNPDVNLAVPLKLNDDPFEVLLRNTVKEVYQQIVSDLLKAETLFKSYKGNIYASLYSAQALLVRVYLFMGENEKAISYADKVINSGKFTL